MRGKILHFSPQVTTPTSDAAKRSLVGREMELAILHQRLGTALQGQRQVVFLAGEPGIGKTALVDAFWAQLQARTDIRITSGQCVEQYGPEKPISRCSKPRRGCAVVRVVSDALKQ